MSSMTHAQSVLTDLYKYLQKLPDETERMGEECSSLVVKISGMSASVQSSTHGSQVGAPQCVSALSSAAQKCGRAVSMLTGHSSSVGNSFGSDGAGTAGNSAQAIKVTPEIRRVQRAVEERVSEVTRLRSSLLSSYSYGTGGESDDLCVFSGKYDSAMADIKIIAKKMQNFANFLGYAYDQYHREQEQAIARALRIPK